MPVFYHVMLKFDAMKMQWAALLAVLVSVQAATATRPTIVESLLSLYNDGSTQMVQEPRDEPVAYPEYDFVIVGAGTAGCVLANRLTEIGDWTVLLLEAGGAENFVMDIPILTSFFQFSDANWKYKTVPSDKACLGLVNNQCNFPRGKVMGGSSVLNYMIYTRGNRRDYDNWEKLGNPGWGYKDVLKYFMKSEDMAMPELKNNTKYHSTGGYLTLSYAPFRTPLAKAWMAAGLETGQNVVDYNAETQIGFSYLQTTTKNGTRWSASRAFLRPIRNRRNLHVRKHARVTNILIDPSTKTAYGVEYMKNSRLFTVRARKEVILSAGAINSPQLLMLSGVGPKKHLQDLKIPVIQNLKVGYNLMDHNALGGLTFVVNESVSLRMDAILENREYYVDYFAYHQGPMALPGGCEALAYYDLKDPSNPDGYPDIELLFQAGSVISEPTLRRNFGITDELYNAVYKPIENAHAWMVLPMIMRPKSRGRIMLRSANPLDNPLIFHNYFANPEDLQIIVDGVKKSIELSQTNAIRKFESRLHDIPIPGCKQHPFGSDEYWGCATRHLTFTIYHQCGTCKMGSANDKFAVVNPRLRVYGIKNLRVIDASIMPAIPTAHTNGPTFMIAEKGADMIKEDWGKLN